MEFSSSLEGMTTSLVCPSYLFSDEDMEVVVDSLSAVGTGGHSGDSEIEVIACYRHHPITQEEVTTGRAMTRDLSG